MHRTPPITWLLALFCVLATTYSLINPLFEAPDEVWHYELVRWLAKGKGLPEPADVGNAPWRQEGAQPPLYYWLGAALVAAIPTDNAATVIRYNPHAAVGNADAPTNKNMMAHGPWEDWPWQGVVLAVHLLRGFSTLLGLVTLFFTWRAAQLVFPHPSTIPWLATALVAFNPQFLFISASVTNDTLVTCCAAIGIWLLLHILYDQQEHDVLPSRQTLFLLGLVLGAAALSKVSGLALSALAGLVLIGVAWRQRSLRGLLRMGVWVATVTAAVALWWYWRNWRLFGDPLAISVLTAALPGRDEPLRWPEVLALGPGVWRSYWGIFGWFNILMDPWLYTFYTILALLAGAGLLNALRQGWGRLRGLAVVLLTVWVLLITVLVVRWAQINYPQGRLLFPAIGALAILLAYGLLHWVPPKAHSPVTTLLTVALLIPAILAPWRWIVPAYQAPQPTLDSDRIPLTPAIWGDVLRLESYAVSSPSVAPGDLWQITLYWQPLQPLTHDYTIFVHLLDENGLLQAQSDSFPAGGSRPTRVLPVGKTVADVHTLLIPPAVSALGQLQIAVGVYDYQSGQRLPVQQEDILTVGRIDIQARQAAASAPVAINFADQIELLDYRPDRTRVTAGETLRIDLTWRALQTLETDYVVFVHLLLPPDAVWAQVDEAPLQGRQPTSSWPVDQLVQDQHTLTIPREAPPGIYRLEIGLYDAQTMERLKVNLEDAGIFIGSVRVDGPL